VRRWMGRRGEDTIEDEERGGRRIGENRRGER
jgi:hypothetical protein